MSKISQRWRTYTCLPREERAIARAAAIGLIETWAGLRILGFRRWKQIVVDRGTKNPAVGSTAVASNVSAERIAQLELAAARNLFFKANCLERSLVLWSLLRTRGYPADLKFGARKQTGEFEAHAWVELRGQALGEDREEHRHYAAFDGAIAGMGTQAE